jgi:hypothetical protein
MSKISYILLILCLVFALLSAGCASSTKVDSTGSSPSSSSTKTDLQLIESHTEPSEGGYYTYVVGTIKNNNVGKTYGYVQVTINLYDKSGAQVGSTLANVNNLEPGGVWKFKAPMIEKDAASYKIKEITGF